MSEQNNALQIGERKFALSFIDPSTECVCDTAMFETSDIVGLCDIVDPGASEIPASFLIELENDDIEKLKERFGIVVERRYDHAHLRPWHFLDELPYVVHTNRELLLMLQNKKPFAVFQEAFPTDPSDSFIPEELFAPHIETGVFVKREEVVQGRTGRNTRVVMYAQVGEEWRANAFLLLRATADKSGWSEGFERMEGSLLGYEDWQNDIYIRDVFNVRNR